jgi:hypothetical protein
LRHIPIPFFHMIPPLLFMPPIFPVFHTSFQFYCMYPKG